MEEDRENNMSPPALSSPMSPSASPPRTPKVTLKKNVSKSATKSPGHSRRLSLFVKDMQEVSSPKRPAEIYVKKKPINGWGFSRWCFVSIATGRVLDRDGMTPLLLYGRQTMTPAKTPNRCRSPQFDHDGEDDERKTCFRKLTRKSTKNASALHILRTSPGDESGTDHMAKPLASSRKMRTRNDSYSSSTDEEISSVVDIAGTMSKDNTKISDAKLRVTSLHDNRIELRGASTPPLNNSAIEGKGSPLKFSTFAGSETASRSTGKMKRHCENSSSQVVELSMTKIGCDRNVDEADLSDFSADEYNDDCRAEKSYEEEDDDDVAVVDRSARPESKYVTPRKPSISLAADMSPPCPTPPLSTTTKAHRKWCIIESTEIELNEMLRLVRRGDMHRLCIRVLNASDQTRRVGLTFKSPGDAIHFYERARGAVIQSHVRNLCDAVIMNDPLTVLMFTDSCRESRDLAVNIMRKDRRNHTALEYARHYNDEEMTIKLEASASIHCMSIAARMAIAASVSAKAQADFAQDIVVGDTPSMSRRRKRQNSEDVKEIVHNRPNRCLLWFA